MKPFLTLTLAGVLTAAAALPAAAQQYGYPQQYNNGAYGQCGAQYGTPYGGRYSGRYGGRYRGRDNSAHWRNRDRDDRRGNGNAGDRRYGNGTYANGAYGNRAYAGNCAGGGNTAVSGTIVQVNGNDVTLQQGRYGGGGDITIDDQPALDAQMTGRVVTGRYVTAYGYWMNGRFVATRLQ